MYSVQYTVPYNILYCTRTAGVEYMYIGQIKFSDKFFAIKYFRNQGQIQDHVSDFFYGSGSGKMVYRPDQRSGILKQIDIY